MLMRLEVISREPALKNPHATPLLFVHGLFIGSWGWAEHFLDYFAARGYSTHALSLRGHGQSEGREGLRWTRLADYVDDVAQVVAALHAPPVLIGHSNGGAIIQKYLETRKAPAAVLLASLPPQGLLRTTVRFTLQHPLAVLRVNLSLSLYPLVSTPTLARDLFFSASMPEEKVRDYQARMSDESYRGFLDILVLNLPKPERITTPMLVMGAANDTSFLPSQVEATARAYHTQAVIFPNMAHGMMLEEGWEAVAGRILAWLQEKGL
jgi:pimeloyl-ACP methyl ester carboxylesterase